MNKTSSNSSVTSVTEISKTYQVYRGLSPTSASRLENRIKELEDAVDFEREGRLRVSLQFDSILLCMHYVDEYSGHVIDS